MSHTICQAMPPAMSHKISQAMPPAMSQPLLPPQLTSQFIPQTKN